MICDVVWSTVWGQALEGSSAEVSVSGDLGGGGEAAEVLICGLLGFVMVQPECGAKWAREVPGWHQKQFISHL